jgi:hypothetical protein
MKSRFIELTTLVSPQGKLLLAPDKIVAIEKNTPGTLVSTVEPLGGGYIVAESPEEVRRLADAALAADCVIAFDPLGQPYTITGREGKP